jgi:hypothetical protein
LEVATITPSSITDLMECGMKFHTLRVLRQWPARPSSNALEFGLALHGILRQVYDPRHRPLPNLDSLPIWTRTAFYARSYQDEDHRLRESERCMALVASYAAQDSDAGSTLAVERAASLEAVHRGEPLFRLYARLDRVLVRDTDPRHLIVRDYKYGRPNVNLLEAYVILRIAKLLYPYYEFYSLELDFFHATGIFERHVIPGASLKGIDGLVRQRAVAVLSLEQPPPEPSEACMRCPLSKSCQPLEVLSMDDALVPV